MHKQEEDQNNPPTLHVAGQCLPCRRVLDTVATPRRVELKQPGAGGVEHGLLQAVAAQYNHWILFSVQSSLLTLSEQQPHQNTDLKAKRNSHLRRWRKRRSI